MTRCEFLDMTQVIFPQNALGGSTYIVTPLPCSCPCLLQGSTWAPPKTMRWQPGAFHTSATPNSCPPLWEGPSGTFRYRRHYHSWVVQPVNNYHYNAIRSFFPQMLNCSSRFGRIEPPQTGLNHLELMRNCHRILVP